MAFSPDIARQPPSRELPGKEKETWQVRRQHQTKVKLTDWGIQSLKPNPNGKRYMVWDTAMQHLAVRVTENGSKSFVVEARKAGQKHPHFEVLGRYLSLPLKAARERVPGILALLRQGKSLKQEAKKATHLLPRSRSSSSSRKICARSHRPTRLSTTSAIWEQRSRRDRCIS